MDEVVPETQIIHTTESSVERCKVGDTLVSSTGEVHGVLASQAVLGHESHGDSPYHRRDGHLDPGELCENSLKVAQESIEIRTADVGPLPATNAVATLKFAGELGSKAWSAEDVRKL
jgi:hypothetical protein